MVSVFVLVVAIAAGPPTLPPLPGEQPPPEDEPLRPAPKEASKPKPKAAPAKPKAKPKSEAEPAPEPEPKPESESATSDPRTPPEAQPPEDSGWSIPQLDEPPQPDGSAPDESPAAEAAPPTAAEGAAPPMSAPELPGDEIERPMFRLPPPERPYYDGTGMFIGAGVTFAIALSEMIVAHVLVKRHCIDPIGRGEIEDTADFGAIYGLCGPGVLPAVALRIHSDIGLLATIGLAAGGGSTRGQRHAWDDVFGTPKARKTGGLRIGGIVLIGTGVVTWFSTGAAAWGMLGNCETSRCANAARAMQFSMRHISAVMVASGAGMLAYAEAHRRHTSRYQRDKLLTMQPMVGYRVAGLTMSGSF